MNEIKKERNKERKRAREKREKREKIRGKKKHKGKAKAKTVKQALEADESVRAALPYSSTYGTGKGRIMTMKAVGKSLSRAPLSPPAPALALAPAPAPICIRVPVPPRVLWRPPFVFRLQTSRCRSAGTLFSSACPLRM